jgi:hypothetical protein
LATLVVSRSDFNDLASKESVIGQNTLIKYLASFGVRRSYFIDLDDLVRKKFWGLLGIVNKITVEDI